MEGFRKITFNNPSDFSEKIQSAHIKSDFRKSGIFKFLGISCAVLFLALAIIFLAAVLPAKDIYSSFQKTSRTASAAYLSLKSQDLEAMKSKFSELETNLSELDGKVGRLSWMKYLPFIGFYQSDASHMARAGMSSIQAAQITIDTITPYADLLGFKGKSTFVGGSADERIRIAVETLDKITPNIDKIAGKIADAEKEFTQVDFDRYPEKIGSTVVKSRLKSVKDLFASTAQLFVDAQPLIKKLPDLLGVKTQKRYLVLFQNDAELRATGGFITAYALFKVDKGKLQVERASDIYKLDGAKVKTFPAPKPILLYHLNVNTFELRDSNLSPDYFVSMNQFQDMISASVPDFPSYDGVISLDTHVLVSAIKILGEFDINGRKLSADNDSRCDCAKAIYELEDYTTKPVAYVREERKDIIGILLYQIMQRALGVSPGKYWGKLFQMFLDEAKQKHVLFYFHDDQAQKGIESLNFGGRMINYSGDFLHINDVNFGGAKSNIFVKQEVIQDIHVASDGTITKKLTLTYKNPAAASNCNLEAGQLCLNGILRNWIRIYVPAGSKLVDFKGSEKETAVYDELGKTVFEGFFTVKPLGVTQVTVTYTLPANLKGSSPYKLYIEKQPGTDGNAYIVQKDGKQIETFPLITDQDLALHL